MSTTEGPKRAGRGDLIGRVRKSAIMSLLVVLVTICRMRGWATFHVKPLVMYSAFQKKRTLQRRANLDQDDHWLPRLFSSS